MCYRTVEGKVQDMLKFGLLFCYILLLHTRTCVAVPVGFGEVLRTTETEHIRNQASVSCQDTG